jgi:hypothetical protein
MERSFHQMFYFLFFGALRMQRFEERGDGLTVRLTCACACGDGGQALTAAHVRGEYTALQRGKVGKRRAATRATGNL